MRFLLLMCTLSAAILMIRALRRRLRPDDAALWHKLLAATSVAAVLIPLLALSAPFVAVVPISAYERTAIVFAAVSSPSSTLVMSWLKAIYVAGVVFFAARMITALVIVHQMRRRTYGLSPVQAASVESALPGIAPRCRVHADQRVVTIGWRRPVVVLSDEMGDWSQERLAAVLRHEAAHMVRRDPLWHAVAALQQALYWPNPLAWWLAREVRRTAEIAADQVAAGDDRVGYAREIIALSEEWLERAAAASSFLAPSASSDLPARIDALLSREALQSPLSPVSTRIAISAVVLAIVIPAAVTVVRPSPQTAHARTHADRHAGGHH